MANGGADLNWIEWAFGIVITGFGAIVGHQYFRLDTLRKDIDQKFDEIRRERAEMHRENRDAIQALGDNYERKQEQIMMQLLGKATRDEVLLSAERVLAAINQRFADRERPRNKSGE